jgi:hypothetical protein
LVPGWRGHAWCTFRVCGSVLPASDSPQSDDGAYRPENHQSRLKRPEQPFEGAIPEAGAIVPVPLLLCWRRRARITKISPRGMWTSRTRLSAVVERSLFRATLCSVLNNLSDSRWPPKYLRSHERHANHGLESWVQTEPPSNKMPRAFARPMTITTSVRSPLEEIPPAGSHPLPSPQSFLMSVHFFKSLADTAGC